jgi:predicted transcriptional regulator
MIATYCSPEIHKSLKIIAVQHDTSIQEIVHEAIVNYIKDNKSNATILD